MKRTQKIETLDLHIIGGNDSIPSAAYVKLARFLSFRQDPEHVMTHLFCCLTGIWCPLLKMLLNLTWTSLNI
jgi:hypothetical protein